MVQGPKCCSSSGLAETVANIEELLTEILVRVPVRPLVRLKCVSKHWLFLISDPKFCHRHMLKNPHPPISAFFSQKSSEFGFVPLHFDHDPTSIRTHGNQNLVESARSCNPLNFVHSLHGIEIVQSCNGLFLCCLQPPRYSYPTTASTLVYYVLNPTTNKFTTLTPPAAAAATTDHPRIFGYALAFDPSKSPHYKVVFLWFANEPPGGCWYPYYHIEIYSSETRSWRLLDTSFNTHPDVFYNVGVYCNGAVHWVGSDGEMSYYHIDEEHVGFVDGFTDSQGWNIGSIQYRYFRESHGGGQLHLIDIHRKCYTKFQVLEMGKDYSGWSVKYNVDLDPLCTAYPHFLQNLFVVLSLAPEENEKDEESSSLLLHVPGKVISYNLRNSTFKSTDLTPKAGVDDSFCRIDRKNHRYVESLAVV